MQIVLDNKKCSPDKNSCEKYVERKKWIDNNTGNDGTGTNAMGYLWGINGSRKLLGKTLILYCRQNTENLKQE